MNHGAARRLSLPAAASDISLGFGSGAQPTIYATSEQGIYVSSDGGANWHKSDLPGDGGQRYAPVATSLHHPETAYVSYDKLTPRWETWMGVAKTTNSGEPGLVWKDSWAGRRAGIRKAASHQERE